MQHTLIPPEERKALRREYRVRVAIVFFFLISIAGIVGIAALFPGFLEAKYDEAAAKAIMSSQQKNDQTGISAIEQTLQVDNALLATLSAGLDASPMSSYASDIASMRGDVRIATMNISRTGTTTVAIAVTGLASTRDALIAFKRRVELARAGNRVDLPVSELAKSKDIDFSMNITEQ